MERQLPYVWVNDGYSRRQTSRFSRRRRRSTDYRERAPDDDFDGDALADERMNIGVFDQRGRPVAVTIQGQNVRDMQPPYEDRGIYANTRRRSRF